MRKKYVLLYAANIAPVGVGEMRKNIEFHIEAEADTRYSAQGNQ